MCIYVTIILDMYIASYLNTKVGIAVTLLIINISISNLLTRTAFYNIMVMCHAAKLSGMQMPVYHLHTLIFYQTRICYSLYVHIISFLKC